ncbi:hypothetical protein [Rheinheimera sp. 4Y26]|uniref:hypothetical protein n=1 Tax=Rheinheimera sp. 4Y26 TaxID=2977811 RepID=UPI0021B13C6E|nr:hypothetical protein [Rheinheimera sp. 4Y26]MCT6699356.1 hypothetical protein [Rheinheimera sp. 4Y26]
MNVLKTTFCQLITACLLFLSTSSNAALIRIETDQQQYQTGDTVTAWLSVENATETLTGFFLALQYQPAQLWLESWTFGTGFDDGFGSYAYSAHDLINGKLSLEEYADWAADLDLLMAQQQQGFVLAAFKFTVKKAGNFVLELDNSYLGLLGQSGNMLVPNWAGINIQVTDPTAVPAPPSALLMLCPLLWLSLRRVSGKKRTGASVVA